MLIHFSWTQGLEDYGRGVGECYNSLYRFLLFLALLQNLVFCSLCLQSLLKSNDVSCKLLVQRTPLSL